jgi:hypothetical protein
MVRTHPTQGLIDTAESFPLGFCRFSLYFPTFLQISRFSLLSLVRTCCTRGPSETHRVAVDTRAQQVQTL